MNPMVDEVNKIICNLLVVGYSVEIPSVGTLHVEWRGARKAVRNRIEPPRHVVVFAPQGGHSLVEAIAREAGCDAAAAQDIFDRWLGRTMQDGTLAIGGLGVLRGGKFTIDPAFDKILNPHGRTPVAVRSVSRTRWIWIPAAMAILCGAGVCGWMLYDRFAAGESLVLTSRIAVPEVKPPVAAEPQPVDSLALIPEAVVEQVAAEPQKAEVTGAERMISGRTYVVLGVFSTEQNALRAVETAKAADPALECGVYYYGAKFMASIFESDDPAACSAFVAAGAARYPDVWCYKAK